MQRKLLRVLDHIEGRELVLIGWGDTEGYFSTQEFMDLIEEVLPGEDPEEVEDGLRDSAMVIPVLDARGVEIGVRSRMAEGMNLFRSLRQWFISQDIQRSRTLVSDYRFIRKARRYPRRDIQFEIAAEEWTDHTTVQTATEGFLRAQVGEFSLAGFQVRATKEILSAWEARRNGRPPASATIVCAGTGSGKTIAFYLPALSSLASELVSDAHEKVRVLAVYPRRELLKDQFNETWRQARLLDATLQRTGSRKIRIGALFGGIKSESKYALDPGEEYLAFGLLKCASDSCDGEMRWSKEDIRSDIERLVCSSCGHQVKEDEIVLTRKSAAARPPDILFTTIETLNQRMSDSRLQHLFGVGTSGSLPLVLLDEVHTYGGVQGAQTALLMRRWMRLSGNRPHFVGLSATLRDAANFFATLTGASRTRVSLIEPAEDEFIEEGAEYLLALRGDPVSQTALLSTTTQTAMLVRRILDNPASRVSNGVWGSKTFVFTDDLDVNNRLFTALADAEGWQQRQGGLQPNPDGPLAQLRNASTTTASFSDLRAFGQDWEVARACGFSLSQDDRARVTRTSSQDSGYDRNADIVVTTASLEIGFNDPSVGAVIQHKAPRGVSSYLQRKGRAGRQRLMRPWMIVVLSEFGRDRVAYQQYETLVDPQISLQSLPISNAHIQKMQAAQAALEWLGSRIANFSVWGYLNNPQKYQVENKALLKQISRVLQPGADQEMLQSYIKSALHLSDSQLDRVSWEAPRSLFLEFLPTLARRLSTNWACWSDDELRAVEWAELPRKQWHSPAPDFIPDSTFGDLDVPELQVRIDRPSGSEWEGMAFFHGLREFAPGRISKRFSVATGAVSDWLVPRDFQATAEDAVVPFEVSEAFGNTASVVAIIPREHDGREISVHQPRVISTSSLFADRIVSDTSNAFPRWESRFDPQENVASEDIPKVAGWDERLTGVTFYTHSSMTQLDTTRFTTGSDSTMKLRDGRSANVRFDWHVGGEPAAVGARMFCDAARLDFQVTEEDIEAWLSDSHLGEALRIALFQDQLEAAPVFQGNRFTANWVFECFVAAIAVHAVYTESDLEESIRKVCGGECHIDLQDIPQFLFQLDTQEYGPDDSGNARQSREQELQRELRTALGTNSVLSELTSSAELLYKPLLSFGFAKDWVRKVLANTICAALQQTICNLLPNVDEKSIRADIDYGRTVGNAITIWISESQTGGIGVIDQVQRLYREDPLSFLRAFHSSLQPGDYEQVDADLFDLLESVSAGGDTADAVSNVRVATSFEDRLSSNRELRRILLDQGYRVSHTFSAVLHSRILRSGSSLATDQRLFGSLERWRGIESRLGIELPMHIAAFVLATVESDSRDPVRIFSSSCELQSTLWTRGIQVRQSALNYYNEFSTGITRTERLLGEAMWKEECESVFYDDEHWLEKIHKALDRDGLASLVIGRRFVNELANIMAVIHVQPLDVRGLEFFPRVEGIARVAGKLHVKLGLVEVLH